MTTAEQFVKAAQDFAISFQYWLIDNCTLCKGIWTYKKDQSRIYTMDELMEIFKKEDYTIK
jgi:hypothetical protein